MKKVFILFILFFVLSGICFSQQDSFYGANIFIEENASQKIKDVAGELAL